MVHLWKCSRYTSKCENAPKELGAVFSGKKLNLSNHNVSRFKKIYFMRKKSKTKHNTVTLQFYLTSSYSFCLECLLLILT